MAKKNHGMDVEKILGTWVDLNEFIRDCTEEQADNLLRLELHNKKRKQFAFRIHSRINKLRADRERNEIMEAIK
jgi:hypothetical protein